MEVKGVSHDTVASFFRVWVEHWSELLLTSLNTKVVHTVKTFCILLPESKQMLEEFGLEAFEHPACSWDLAPAECYLFPTLKKFLGGRRFKSDEVVEEAVKEWLTFWRRN